MLHLKLSKRIVYFYSVLLESNKRYIIKFDETAKDVHFFCTIYFQLFYSTVKFSTINK